jgi:N-acetylglutamate synthase-like GNAT family acetyltransferase
MNFEISEFRNLDKNYQQGIAFLVSEYTKGNLGEKPKMLPIRVDEVYKKFEAYTVIAEGQFAGFIGAASPLPHNSFDMCEVGTLWVPKNYRGNKIAHALIGAITNKLVSVNTVPYSFANTLSYPIFIDMDYEEVVSSEIPTDAFNGCTICPDYLLPRETICCDRTMIYKG